MFVDSFLSKVQDVFLILSKSVLCLLPLPKLEYFSTRHVKYYHMMKLYHTYKYPKVKHDYIS